MRLNYSLRRTLTLIVTVLGLMSSLGMAVASATDTPEESERQQVSSVVDESSDANDNDASGTSLLTPTPSPATTPGNALGTTPATPTDSSTSTPSPTIAETDESELSSTEPAEKPNKQTSHVVRFDLSDGTPPTQTTVRDGTLASPPESNPQREGHRFNGWTYKDQVFDFRIPVREDMTLTAQWVQNTDWQLSPDHGPASGARLTINPPSSKEPRFSHLESSGDQLIGQTSNGGLYTWNGAATPASIPAPSESRNAFHYLQAGTGDHWQAALGSDHHLYTWAIKQPAPTIPDVTRETLYTSISTDTSHGWLLAVDQQGRIHTLQADGTKTEKTGPRLSEQAVVILPEQAHATLVTTAADQALAVDANGQVWTWNMTDADAHATCISQPADTPIIQVESVGTGFVLMDTTGQASYLAGDKTAPSPIRLPDDKRPNRVSSSGNQVLITDTKGLIWAWKPNSTPTQVDGGKQSYIQALTVGSKTVALNLQGEMLAWSTKQKDKPVKVVATTAPTLDAASFDDQPLTLTRSGDAWQADAPAREAGQATVTINGKQDNQPFSKSFTYTVEEPLARAAAPSPTYTVTFDTDGGSPRPGTQYVPSPYGRVQRPTTNPVRSGYLFDGWFNGRVAYDFSKPVTSNLTLTAHWTFDDPSNIWQIDPDRGSQYGGQSVRITPPANRRGIKFNQTSSAATTIDDHKGYSLAIGSDGNAYAWGSNQYGQLGDGTTTKRSTPVVVKKPYGVAADFTYVQVSAGGYHSLALGSDGYVYAWGLNSHGQLGNNTCGGYTTSPARVRNPNSPTNRYDGLAAVQVAGGSVNSMALGTDGTVYTWGSQARGWNPVYTPQQPVPVPVRDPSNSRDNFHAVQISTKWSFNLAIGTDDYVYAWGYNTDGQLGNNSSDGRNTTTFYPTPTRVRDPTRPMDATRGFKAVQVSAGGWHALAIGTDGRTWAWGQGQFGQLGNNSVNNACIPVLVCAPGSNGNLIAAQVITGTNHSFAIASTGTTWAWGLNSYGQLGDGKKTGNSPNCVPVRILSTVHISAGDEHSLGIDLNGDTKAWGDNSYGQLGDTSISTQSPYPVLVVINLQPVITGVRFDQSPGTNLTLNSDGRSVTVVTPAHQPGLVTVSVDYKLGDMPQQPDTSLSYLYLPVGVLPDAGGAGMMLMLLTGVVAMGGIAAQRHHRQSRQLNTSLE